MLRFAANLSMLFTEVDFLLRFGEAKLHNFNEVEFLFPYAYSPITLKELIEEHELSIELFNLPPGDWDTGDRGLAAIPGRENEFCESVEKALEYAQILGVQKLHCMAGLCENDTQRQVELYQENLSYAAHKAQEQSVRLLIEPHRS